MYFTYTLKTKLQYKFYGSSTDDPARDRSARALVHIKVRLILPYNRQVAWDLEQFPLVARREARRDKVCMASAPQHPYVSTSMGIHVQPSSEHFASLALCLHTSAVRAADPLVTPASINVLEFNVDVTDMYIFFLPVLKLIGQSSCN